MKLRVMAFAAAVMLGSCIHGYSVVFRNLTTRKMHAIIDQHQDPAGWFCSDKREQDIDPKGAWDKGYGGCCVDQFKVIDNDSSKVVKAFGTKMDLRGKQAVYTLGNKCSSAGVLYIWYDNTFNLQLTHRKPDSGQVNKALTKQDFFN